MLLPSTWDYYFKLLTQTEIYTGYVYIVSKAFLTAAKIGSYDSVKTMYDNVIRGINTCNYNTQI